MSKCIVWVILVSSIVCLAPLGAQTTTAEIVGTVTDSSGGTIAGATIIVTNMDSSIAVKATTNASGNYLVTAVGVALEERDV
jgi:hypothetical protein